MKKHNHKKGTPFSEREGTIEVKVRDRDFNVIYENSVGVGNKKAMGKLFNELSSKGVMMPRSKDDGWW